MLQCIMIAGSLMMVDPSTNEAISINARGLSLENTGLVEDSWVLSADERNYHTKWVIPTELAQQGIVAVLKDCERMAKENG